MKNNRCILLLSRHDKVKYTTEISSNLGKEGWGWESAGMGWLARGWGCRGRRNGEADHLILSVQGSNFVPTPGEGTIPPLLEITPGGPFGTKLSMRTKFGPNFQKNHI